MITVVDDDPGVRVSLHALLRSLGHRAELFDSGEALLASAALDASECVISDLRMRGGMDGIALAQAIARLPARPPVILIPALSDEGSRSAAAAAGVFAVLEKPFDGEVLIAAIEDALASPRPGR